MTTKFQDLPYDVKKLPRELAPDYISATDQEINEMLSEIGLSKLEDLYSHIPQDIKFQTTPEICEKLDYLPLIDHVKKIAEKNKIKTSFIGDGLKNYKVMDIVNHVSNVRGLATAYTPYQPERSQGTLTSLYLYSSALSSLTGFEAVNASMYDRATCLFEALNSSLTIVRGANTVIVLESNYPGDLEVIKTLAKETKMNVVTVPINTNTGTTDISEIKKTLKNISGKPSTIAFPQVNSLGNLEDVHSITDLCHEMNLMAVAVIDPMLISNNCLVPPSAYGTSGGAHIFVAEGQHLAIGPNFGGPGLGIFGVRYNLKNKLAIRSTPGRYVGKGKDSEENDALCMVLSTREQHIRRDKAGSNICSNESYIATLAGASMLERGAKGIAKSAQIARKMALKAIDIFTSYDGIRQAFSNTPFFNEFTLITPIKAFELINRAKEDGLHIGVDVSERAGDKRGYHLMVSCSDIHTNEELKKLDVFLSKIFQKANGPCTTADIPKNHLRNDEVRLPEFSTKELQKFYDELGNQNISPDNTIYPLGSCTMKYNPFINEYLANLPGFTNVHPQAPEEDCQGCLEILYEIQQMFKNMTGLPGVALVPVAGAQGELAGIKMFQAWHRDRGEGDTRNIILILKSAHGTNPATATMAGLETKKINGTRQGIIEIGANSKGQIDMDELQNVISEYGPRICGIMVTNPNTSGIFEENFKEMADLIHEAGGLVYMDGANMNAIAGWVDFEKMGVDAAHNNLHKTWSIPHGGGGPGDAIVAVSEKLLDYIPGIQVKKNGDLYETYITPKSIGNFHRHFGNFAHKVRAYAYLKALGSSGIKRMAAVAVLSSRYLFHKLQKSFQTLPADTLSVPRMHEFILTLDNSDFEKITHAGIPKPNIIAQIGKLFLDFGLHAPTVAFPEIFGLMVEPTESFTKVELDRFVQVVKIIRKIINEHPETLKTVPHFTPVRKVDEVGANKNLNLFEPIDELPKVKSNVIAPSKLSSMDVEEIFKEIIKSSQS